MTRLVSSSTTCSSFFSTSSSSLSVSSVGTVALSAEARNWGEEGVAAGSKEVDVKEVDVEEVDVEEVACA